MEYIFCSTVITIASNGTYHTVGVGRNIDVGGGWRNDVGGFGGGAVFLCSRYLAESGLHWWGLK